MAWSRQLSAPLPSLALAAVALLMATQTLSCNTESTADCDAVIGYQFDSSHDCLHAAQPLDGACEVEAASASSGVRELACLVRDDDVFLVRWGYTMDLKGERWVVHGLQQIADRPNEFYLDDGTPQSCLDALNIGAVESICSLREADPEDCDNQWAKTFNDAMARYIPWCEFVDGSTAVRDSPATPCLGETPLDDPICCGRDKELPGTSCVDLSDGGTIYGSHGRCLEQDESFDLRVVGGACCDPLVPIQDTFPSDTGETVGNLPEGCAIGALSAAICSACGNGTCDDIENRCNCPADCLSLSNEN